MINVTTGPGIMQGAKGMVAKCFMCKKEQDAKWHAVGRAEGWYVPPGWSVTAVTLVDDSSHELAFCSSACYETALATIKAHKDAQVAAVQAAQAAPAVQVGLTPSKAAALLKPPVSEDGVLPTTTRELSRL